MTLNLSWGGAVKHLVWSWDSKDRLFLLEDSSELKEHLKPLYGVWTRLVQTDGQETVEKEFWTRQNSCLVQPGNSFGESRTL